MNARIIVLHGPPLTGKTEAGRALAKVTDFHHADNDVIRQAIFPNDLYYKLEQADRFHFMAEAYRAMVKSGQLALRVEVGAILTGTFSRPEFKQPLIEWCDPPAGRRLKVFTLMASDHEIAQRIQTRDAENPSTNSIRTMKQYQRACAMFEPIDFVPVTTIITDRKTPEEVAEEIFGCLR